MSERILMASGRSPSTTAAFELPSVPHAIELFGELHSNWVGWIENRLEGIFVVVRAPERISELNELLASVEKWLNEQAFLAIRFHLDGRVYIMQRGGFIGPADHTAGEDRKRLAGAPES